MPTTTSRSGTVLIVVAGISALLAGLGLAFLARMRSDSEESQVTIRETQAHIMLVAACTYLQEASRLGYDGAGTDPYHREGFGWIDIRDGRRGPKATHERSDVDPTTSGLAASPDAWGRDDDSAFPVMTYRRVPMYAEQVPPFAIRLDAAPNPIDPANGIPYLSRPDPMPVRAPADWNNPTAAEFEAFEKGDPTPRANTVGLAWFRLFRLGGTADPRFARYNAATFIVTCGAGGSQGFRSWTEVATEGQQPLFGGDPQLFATLREAETRLWYLVEWSPAVGGQYLFNLVHHRDWTWDANNDAFSISQYDQFPVNYSHYSHSQAKIKNYGGTIRLVQRLVNEPPEW
jgi:hypothetical protein